MNRFFKAVACVLAAVFFHGLAEAAEPRYDVESGIIEYEMTGQTSGNETLYFDDYGRKEARYSNVTMEMMGMVQETNSLYLLDGDWAYMVDLQSRTASKIPVGEMMGNMRKGDQQMSFKQYSEEFIKAMGGSKTGSDTVLGKSVDVYTVPDMGFKLWIWGGIPLKVEMDMFGFGMKMVATNIRENVPVDEGRFQLPDDIIVEEAPAEDYSDFDLEEVREAAEMMRTMQQDPEFQQQMEQLRNFQGTDPIPETE